MFSKSSIGVDWNGAGWDLAVLSRRLGYLRIGDRIHVEAPLEEAREKVAEFVDKNRAREARVIACLPRRCLLVRFLDLPADTESQLAKVVGFQVDTLHPFPAGEVYWDSAVVSRDREKKQIRVVVVLAEKSRLDQYFQDLLGLGLRVTSMTLLAACLAPLLKAVTGEAGLVIFGRRDGLELLGFYRGDLRATREISAESDEGASERFQRELHAVRSALPVEDPATIPTYAWGHAPESFAGLLEGVAPLPSPKLDWITRSGLDLKESWPAIGAAYADLQRMSVATLNLLPPHRRWQPTRNVPLVLYALGSLAVLLAVAAGIHPWVAKAIYARALDRQIEQRQAQAAGVRKQIQEAANLGASAEVLEGVRQKTWQKLRVLEELTKLLPDGTWLDQMDVDQDSVVIFGLSDRAADLVQPLENSPYFSQVEFTSPITRDSHNKEIFRIRMRLGKPAHP